MAHPTAAALAEGAIHTFSVKLSGTDDPKHVKSHTSSSDETLLTASGRDSGCPTGDVVLVPRAKMVEFTSAPYLSHLQREHAVSSRVASQHREKCGGKPTEGYRSKWFD